MTKAQQRIAALLIDLEKSVPTVFQFVQVGIEYKLFRLNQEIEVWLFPTIFIRNAKLTNAINN